MAQVISPATGQPYGQAVAGLHIVAHGDEVSRNTEAAQWGGLCMGSRWKGGAGIRCPG